MHSSRCRRATRRTLLKVIFCFRSSFVCVVCGRKHRWSGRRQNMKLNIRLIGGRAGPYTAVQSCYARVRGCQLAAFLSRRRNHPTAGLAPSFAQLHMLYRARKPARYVHGSVIYDSLLNCCCASHAPEDRNKHPVKITCRGSASSKERTVAAVVATSKCKIYYCCCCSRKRSNSK